MVSIQRVMTADHKKCDELFISAEQFVANNNWDAAQQQAEQFIRHLLAHFQHEENILFPAFEETTGMRNGPTQMMRHEHDQMKSLVVELELALKSKNQDRYLGLSESLMIFMQQHNMKEEQILYPMIDEDCADRAEELTRDIVSTESSAA